MPGKSGELAQRARREKIITGLPAGKRADFDGQLTRFEELVDVRMAGVADNVRARRREFKRAETEWRYSPERAKISDALILGTEHAFTERVREAWQDTAVGRGVSDHEVGARAVADVYELLGLPVPPISVWVESPEQARVLGNAIAQLAACHLAESRTLASVDVALAQVELERQLSPTLLNQAHSVIETLCDSPVPLHESMYSIDTRLAALLERENARNDILLGYRAPLTNTLLRRGYSRTRREQLRAITAHLFGQTPRRGRRSLSTDPWDDSTVLEQFAELNIEEPYRLRSILDLREAAYLWFGYRGFAILCPHPTIASVDGEGRMHGETGPALRWPDGWAIYAWHGTVVPASLIERGWGVGEIFSERNLEVRRCAIERLGWPQFIEDARLQQVGPTAPDPANPGFTLTLYDIPRRTYFDDPARVLICTNASPERDGTRRTFGLLVPATVPDAITAASWTFGLDPHHYLQLAAAS